MHALITLDGCGISEKREGNVFTLARTPTLDHLQQHYPHGRLQASGTAVGLSPGQVGNSRIGHLELGMGRVFQDPTGIESSIRDTSFFRNRILSSCLNHCQKQKSTLHLIGFLDTPEPPTPILRALLEWAEKKEIQKIRLHIALDGEEATPFEGTLLLKKLMSSLEQYRGVQLASLMGSRYLADQTGRWDRTEKLYRLLAEGKGAKCEQAIEYVESCYRQGIGDHNIPPTQIQTTPSESPGWVHDNDAIIFFSTNHTSSVQQISRAFSQKHKHRFNAGLPPRVRLVHLLDSDPSPAGSIAFEPKTYEQGLAHLISEAGLSQLRITESIRECYSTLYFNGGSPKRLKREDRVIIPSGDTISYDRTPQLEVQKLTDSACRAIDSKRAHFIVINFANADLLGHTGNLKAAIKATEIIDASLAKILAALNRVQGKALITSDHGNAEEMIHSTGRPHCGNTINDVPFYLFSTGEIPKLKKNQGILADVAPTLLSWIGINPPPTMTGESLIKREGEH
jgi:2,3-bisphosphoglycerate-independent phosphoglycerate mutase